MHLFMPEGTFMTFLTIMIEQHQNIWISGILRRYAAVSHMEIRRKRNLAIRQLVILWMNFIHLWKWSEWWSWWGYYLLIILRVVMLWCVSVWKEGRYHSYICLCSLIIIDYYDGFSDVDLGTDQLEPYCGKIVELKKKSFDLKNGHFRTGIVLLLPFPP